MDNSYFIYSEDTPNIVIKRFHICTWEFRNNSGMVEFGMEIEKGSIGDKDKVNLALYIPWLDSTSVYTDFYDKLKSTANSKFIFNDSVVSTTSFDGGLQKTGVIHKLKTKGDLCILPAKLTRNGKRINIEIETKDARTHTSKGNLYVRFAVTPKKNTLTLRKGGFTKSTVIYDIKLNEKRNLPDTIKPKHTCTVESCFCFNIIPNNHSIEFLDSTVLKNVRTLEYESFNQYLDNDKRVRKNELVVVFNKKQEEESYTFFSMYSKERIGVDQLSVAVLVNLFAGIFLFLPSLRDEENKTQWELLNTWEIYVVVGLFLILIIYMLFSRKIASALNL